MDERAALMGYLTSRRRQVIEALDGLSDAQAHAAPLPSGWSPLGAVQHLALDVERFWFRFVMAGEPVMLSDDAWHVGGSATVRQLVDLYGRECAAADATIAGLSLDARPRHWPDGWGTCPVENLRDALLHVITETATHVGQLDVVRELIDGRQRLVMP